MKEIKFARCFINGKKSGIASYDSDKARILFFSQSLGAGQGVDDLRAAGVSLHQFNNSIEIPSASAEGVSAVLPGAIVEWEGSKEYQARAQAAVGSRGGAASSATPAAPAPAPAFVHPAADDVPAVAEVCKMMPALRPEYTAAGDEYAASLVVGASDDLEISATEKLTAAGAFAPAVLDALKIYGGIIRGAWAAWCDAERKRKEEEEKRAKEEEEKRAAAAAAAAAAADGKTLVTLPDGSTVAVSGRAHCEFAAVCQLVKRGRNVYLYGHAGTGKTYLCKQIADALDLPFHSDQKISNDFQLTGFVDAAGKFQETELYRAVTRGGVYMLDEFDASDECAAVILNTALANGYMTFPGVGRVEVHPNFRCIACGNTIGRGASSNYTGRNCLDAATLDRFVIRSVGYDPAIELQKAGGDKNLVDFIHAVRAAVETCGVSLVVSMRAIENIAAVSDCFPAAECLGMGLFKGLEKDQIKLIATACKGRGRWFDALENLAA